MSKIISSAVLTLTGQDAFANFQEEMGDAPDANRFYLEYLAMTNIINKNFVQVTDEALEMMATGYRTGLPLTINHEKGFFDQNLGIGQTVAAEVRHGALYIRGYIAKNKTYKMPTIGSSQELIDAIMDGYVKNGSTSINIIEAHCSVCEASIDGPWGCEEHRKGRKMVITDAEGDDDIVVPYIIVTKAEAIEFSITMLSADPNSQVTQKNLNMYLNNFIDDQTYRTYFVLNNNPEPASAGDPTPEPEGGSTPMTEQEKQALEAELQAAKATIVAHETTINSQNVQLQANDAELKTLREQAVANSIMINDGKTARKQFEDDYIDEFTAYVGDACTPEIQSAQRELIKDFSLEVLKQKTKDMSDHNKKNYPAGSEFRNDGNGDGNGSDLIID